MAEQEELRDCHQGGLKLELARPHIPMQPRINTNSIEFELVTHTNTQRIQIG